jgi:dCMP deaminase
MKRQNYLDWDTTLMGIAQLISLRSKDPNTRHGAVIVDQDYKIISMGYNGFARGVNDDIFPWTSPEKYDYVLHAERNAIDNSLTSNLKGCKLYLWSEKGYLPCSQCAAGIIQKGISEIIIAMKLEENTKAFNWTPTRKMFEVSDIKVRILKDPVLSITKIIDEFSQMSKLIETFKKGKSNE